MAKKLNGSFETWRKNLPLQEQPLHRLLELLKDPELPKALRIEGLLQASKFFSATLTQSKNQNTIEGELGLRPMPVGPFQIRAALASLPLAERLEILSGKKAFELIEEHYDNE